MKKAPKTLIEIKKHRQGLKTPISGLFQSPFLYKICILYKNACYEIGALLLNLVFPWPGCIRHFNKKPKGYRFLLTNTSTLSFWLFGKLFVWDCFLIFPSCRFSTAQVALILVLLQDLTDLEVKLGVFAAQVLCNVLVYRALADAKARGGHSDRCVMLYNVFSQHFTASSKKRIKILHDSSLLC